MKVLPTPGLGPSTVRIRDGASTSANCRLVRSDRMLSMARSAGSVSVSTEEGERLLGDRALPLHVLAQIGVRDRVEGGGDALQAPGLERERRAGAALVSSRPAGVGR